LTYAALEPEFSLLVRCCQWNFAAADGLSRPAIPNDLDWVRFVNLARRHRIQGLVWNALAQHADRLPDQVKAMLSNDARSIAATNLAIAGECRELRQTFDQSKLFLLFIKGLAVGALAYRSPLLKMGWDIDLLIDPRDLPAAAELLSRRGFALRLPANPTQLQSWHARSKESVWSRDESVYIELHTRLADNLRLIPKIDVQSARQLVDISPGVALPTLAGDELFAYLAVHGASSAWFRLKWIADFAGLLHGRRAGEVRRLYTRSQQLGAGRAAGQALLLADALFGALDAAPELKDMLTSDRATRLLFHAAMRMLTTDREPTGRPLGTLAIHWTQFLLMPGIAYKLSEFRRQGESLLLRGNG
jgi:hypothetical protein